jgi:hypothetical protein
MRNSSCLNYNHCVNPIHLYSIKLDRPNGEPRIYRVRIAGDVNCDFFVGITPSQNIRGNVKPLIEEYCEKRFDRVPRNGQTIEINLDQGLMLRRMPQ